MASRTDEIQKLIADIDGLLAHSSKLLPRLLPGQAPEDRQVLEKVREFLVQLVEDEAPVTTNPAESVQPLSSLLERFIEQGQNPTASQSYQTAPKQDNFQTIQLKSEFSALLQPLQAEISELLQQRNTIAQEIRELEQKRLQNYSLTQQLATQEQIISDFLQTLMGRLTASLTIQSPQSLGKEGGEGSAVVVPKAASVAEPAQQMEHLNALTRELDQHLLSLDSTVNVVFSALQNNINTYYQSLSESLARMHSQGLQGEQVMANLLASITQYSPPQVPDIPTWSPPIGQEVATSTPITDIDHLEVETLEEENYTEDLDAVLSDLNLDQSLSLKQDSADLVSLSSTSDDHAAGMIDDLDQSLSLEADLVSLSSTSDDNGAGTVSDEVDELYASLFGVPSDSNLPDAPQATPELTDLAITEAESEDLASSQAVELSDTWLNQQEMSLLSEVTESLLESTSEPSEMTESLLEFTSEPSESWDLLLASEEITATTETALDDVYPDSAETITVLTDLLVDVSSDQMLLELPSWSESPEITTPDLTSVTATAVPHQQRDLPADNYIPASPKENLLSWENTVASSVPEIFLDEGQIQQLDRDLANFDRQSLESQANLQEFQNLLSLSQSPLVTNEAARESLGENLSASIDLSSTTEKKKEDLASSPAGSLSGNGEGLIDHQKTVNLRDAVWYLGLDLGTTGISAALLNRSHGVVYPLYWSAEAEPGVTAFDQSFRLPAEVYLPTAAIAHAESDQSLEQIASVTEPQERAESTPRLYSAQLKPYLQVAIPYRNDRQKWEPVLKLNDSSAGPLIWVVRSLSKLLSTLKSVPTSTTPALIAQAVGLEADDFSAIINKISGVICTCPSSWSEQYRFNVREAILSSQLVAHPEQVFFIEEAIASLLPEINGANGETVQINSPPGLTPLKASEYPLLGHTLIINIGATATEMALVDLPANKRQLTHKDFMLHSFNYAGKGMEQDIICQLLLPPKSRQPRPATQDTDPSNNPWHWQPSIPGLDQVQWQSLQLEGLELPKVGEPDLSARIYLQQRLESSPLGQALLDAAVVLKLILQHQETFTLDLADQRWLLQRRDLESQVFVPFVRRLNRELNKLLVARGIPTEAINQAILTGGVASIGTVSRWLRQKLPNAKIIQDVYLGENGAPNCTRVAYGLALLPLHPQVLDAPRQQYTDYFLFTELLNLLPDRSLSFGEVLQLFEGRGVNTRACQQRLLAFLEGELPAGLIPVPLDTGWLTKHSQVNPDYQAIAKTPLFEKLGNLTYRPNGQQLLVLRRYLEAIKAHTLQSLEEPYTVNFVLELHN